MMTIAEETRQTLLHLSLISRVGPATVERLVAALGSNGLRDIYCWRAKELSVRTGISLSLAELIVQGLADKKLLHDELQRIEKYAVSWVTLFDEKYPPLLKEIHLPPLVLYWRGGDCTMLAKCIAFVGSRKANIYALKALKKCIPPLLGQQWTVVSGGALGADALAHRVTLDAGGRTVAVIGSGLCNPYPTTNRQLFSYIVERGGMVMSCFPLLSPAVPGNFPARNRIIAGLSRATIVVQAAEKSGALITASFALEQGREVGAIPGSIDDELSAGCNNLLRQGATVITSSADILMMLNEEYHAAPEKPVTNLELPHDNLATFPEPIRQIIRLCKQPQSLQELHEVTQLSIPELQTLLCDLQFDGHLEQTMQGLWVGASPCTRGREW
jgi:DNA processing protein